MIPAIAEIRTLFRVISSFCLRLHKIQSQTPNPKHSTLLSVLSLPPFPLHIRTMGFKPEDEESFNADVSKWTIETKEALVNQMNSLGIVHRENSSSEVPAQKALKSSTRKQSGIVNKISFRMPRHMVFVAKGKGRLRTDGTTNRQPKDWFNSVVDSRMDSLTDIVADHSGNLILNALLIK